MITILEQRNYIWKQGKLFYIEMLFFWEKIFIEIKTTLITWRIE